MASPPSRRPPQEAPERSRIGFDARILIWAFLVGLPGVAVALILLWTGDFTPRVQWTLTLVIVGGWWGFASALRDRVVRPLQTLSNLLAALLEGDYSIRSRAPRSDDPLSLAFNEVNALSQTLREQRLGALEATALLRKVMEEIDVAIFAFDDLERLRLTNRAGERLMAQSAERLLGRSAEELGLAEALQVEASRTVDFTFPGSVGRFEFRTTGFRQGGLPHKLLVVADLSRTLREEERKAWQRIVRVLGHEINNSLAPIKSIAGSLASLLARQPRPADLDDDLRRGLAVIQTRSEALSRFMASYARLARLPAPQLAPIDVAEWVNRGAGLETRVPITISPGPPAVIDADGDQLDQLLINLLRNAADASLETGGGVRVSWGWRDGQLEVLVDDDGPGIADTANLFVPFFTTKPNGSGIGLVLCRQIAEAHGGSLALANRPDGRGARALVRLPAPARRS
ncbi:MAG: PAS domain-containing sensor histidine kinase [Gemmatimonadetes bacterium]|nr:PAS domain-containing sensor histidine kinase [Gemmatimonadota bacterium]